MDYGITREHSLDLLQQHLRNPNLTKHCRASEAVLQGSADDLGL